MSSNPVQTTALLRNPSPAGNLQIAFYTGEQYRVIGIKYFLERTVREICNEPYVIRVQDPAHGTTYFVGAEEPYLKLKSEGKSVQWIHDLIEYWRQTLIFRGFSKETSIYHWKIRDVFLLQKSLIVLAGSEVETKQ